MGHNTTGPLCPPLVSYVAYVSVTDDYDRRQWMLLACLPHYV